MEIVQRWSEFGDTSWGFLEDNLFYPFRLNAGKVSRHTTERLDSFVDAIAGKRITYAQLTKGKTWFDADSLAQEI